MQGLQAVRRQCCDGVNFARRLHKKHWGRTELGRRWRGMIGDASVGVAWPESLGVQHRLGSVDAAALARRLSVCGVRGDVVPILALAACRATVGTDKATSVPIANATLLRQLPAAAPVTTLTLPGSASGSKAGGTALQNRRDMRAELLYVRDAVSAEGAKP